MKKNDRITIKLEWLELIRGLEADDFKALIMAILGYARGREDFTGLSPGAKMAGNLLVKEIETSRLKARCGALGGNPRLKHAGAVRERATADTAQFEMFWGEYPKKVGKKYARKCFERLKPTGELLEKMLSSIKEQKKSEQWQREGGRFIPNPATWLNQGRWMDEVMEASTSAEFKEFNIGVHI